MKALTVKQPWAHLICAGIKDVENRSWKTNFRGRVLIHSSAKYEEDLFETVPIIENGVDKLKTKIFGKIYNCSDFETSAIIGSVEIVDCVQNHQSIWADKGYYHWILRNPILFKNPILNVKGKLSFWESGYDVCKICGNPTHITDFMPFDPDCCIQCGNSKIKASAEQLYNKIKAK
jgi:hypothetical protein